MRRTILLGLAWLIGIGPGFWLEKASAQDERQNVEGSLGTSFLLRTWSRMSGMPHGTVNAIAQSADGYLWLGTFDGLARFDGRSFRTFDLSDGLASNRITSLLVDRRGDLWVGHEVEGLSRISGDRIASYTVADGLPAGTFWTIFEHPDGTLFFGTERGLVSLAPGEARIGDEKFRREGSFDGPIHGLLVDRAGVLWAAGRHGLSRRAPGSTDFEAIQAPPGAVFSLLENRRPGTGADGPGTGLPRARDFRSDGLWLGNVQGLWHGVPGAGGWTWSVVIEADCPVESAVTTTSVAFGQDGDLWFRPCTNALLASDTLLYRLPAATLLSDQPSIEQFELEGVPASSALLAAPDGGLWIGTFGRGIGALIPRMIQRWTLGEDFQVQELRAMVGDGEGGLFISANCGSPLIHFKDGRFTQKLLGPSDDGKHGCIGGLARGSDGDLWVGSGGDLVRIRGDGSVYRRTLIEREGLEIYSILEGRDGEVWAGLSGYGLARLDGGGAGDVDIGDARVTFFTRDDGLASDHVHSLTQDRDGDLWIGTHQGLSHFRDGRIRTYREEDGMLPGMVRVIHEDSEGVLWIGTYGGGLARFEDGRFTRFTTEVGLYENVVTHLLEDRQGRFWMLGNRGLFYHPREQLEAFAAGEIDELQSVFFDESDGMIEGSGGRQPSGWQMADGRLYFATVDGLAMIDSERVDVGVTAPSIHVEEVLVEGRLVTASDGAPVVLEPGQRDLEIHYTSPGSFDAEKTRFRYRLEGFDGRWSEVGERRTAYFTHLPPGDYTFRVSAANRYGRWNEEGAALALVVEAPWWRTRTAFVLYLLAAGSALWLYVRRQKLQIQKGEELLEERTQQLHQLADLLPICAACKKVRDDEGYWEQMEVFFSNHSNLRFSHGLCPECSREVLEELDEA